MTTGARSHALHTVDLDLHPNEASDLLPVESDELLRAHGWHLAFWTVLDEGCVEDSLAVIGHTRGSSPEDDAWEIVRPRFRVTDNAGRTEDAEACTRLDGWVYVVGSHYGSKGGPLETKRAFLARFRETDLAGDLEGSRPEMQVARNKFRLHRAVNDALRAFGPPLLAPGPTVRERFVERTRRDGPRGAARRINDGDVPLNVEGATFDAHGSLLLGLRYPVTADGHPIVAELAGVETMLDDERAAPVVRRFWVIENVGTHDAPTGIRALHRRGDELHVITGSLDATGKGSALLEDHPAGGQAQSAHHCFVLPGNRDGGAVEAELVQPFDLHNVEGLASDPQGYFYYVTDEDDRVRVRYMRGEAPVPARYEA